MQVASSAMSANVAWRTTLPSGKALLRALVIAFVAGLVLNGINQGSAWWNGQGLNLWLILFTFAVPLVVSTVSVWVGQRGPARLVQSVFELMPRE